MPTPDNHLPDADGPTLQLPPEELQQLVAEVRRILASPPAPPDDLDALLARVAEEASNGA